MWRHELLRRSGQDDQPGPELRGRVVGHVAVAPGDFGSLLSGPSQQTTDDERADRVEGELERRDHTEVAASSLAGPQQFGMLPVIGPDLTAVGRHQLDGGHVVTRQPEVGAPATRSHRRA